ncbi:MAG: NUDIX domain-containing protein [bacterium]|nr:NUDIX domain-containing protein [bacterium]
MEHDKNLRPRVGLGVLIFKEGKVLLGQRKSALGMGEYSIPGGHMEYMESFEECARREVKEETGLEVENMRFLSLSNNKKYLPKHYVEVGFVAEWKSGEAKTLEPDKIGDWKWYNIDELPEPHFSLLPNLIESYKTGKIFWDN